MTKTFSVVPRQMLSFLLWLVIAMTIEKPSSAQVWGTICGIAQNPIQDAYLDSVTGELFLNNPTNTTPTNTGLRGRRINVFFDDRNATTNATAAQNASSTNATLLVGLRECTCHQEETLYCPSFTDTCRVGGGDTPICYNSSSTEVFGVILWICAVAYASMGVLALCVTRRGRTVVEYFIRIIYPKYNTFIANRMLRNDPERATKMIRDHMQRRQQARHRYGLHTVAVAPVQSINENPTSLVLKTSVYRTFSSSGDEDDDGDLPDDSHEYKCNHSNDDDHHCDDSNEPEEECSICFVPLEDGDRVGSFPCKHLFHVEPCLKEWLKTRNVCPLCIAQDVAEPRYD